MKVVCWAIQAQAPGDFKEFYMKSLSSRCAPAMSVGVVELEVCIISGEDFSISLCAWSVCHPFLHFTSLATCFCFGVLCQLMILNGRINWISVVPGSVIRVPWQDKVIHLNEISSGSQNCPFPAFLPVLSFSSSMN